MSPRYQCSSASAERDEPMFATGSWVRGWVLVEVPGTWGEDAIHSSAFGEFAPQRWKDELKGRNIRVVCIRSHRRAGATDVRVYTCAAAPRPAARSAVAPGGGVARRCGPRRAGAPDRPAAEWAVGARP